MSGSENRLWEKIREVANRFTSNSEKSRSDPEQLARDAFMLLNTAGREGQISLLDFEKTFDTKAFCDVAIFKATTERSSADSVDRVTTIYSWFCIVRVSDSEVRIFEPISYSTEVNSDSFAIQTDSQKLSLMEIHPTQTLFDVTNFVEVFYKEEGYVGIKIELISGGLRDQIKVKRPSTQGSPVLMPVQAQN